MSRCDGEEERAVEEVARVVKQRACREGEERRGSTQVRVSPNGLDDPDNLNLLLGNYVSASSI